MYLTAQARAQFIATLCCMTLFAIGLSWIIAILVVRVAPAAVPWLRAFALAFSGLVGTMFFVGLHPAPTWFLLAPLAVYPLVASERGAAVGTRVLVLGEVSALLAGEYLSLLEWRDGWHIPDAAWYAWLAVLVVGVPSAAFWAAARSRAHSV